MLGILEDDLYHHESRHDSEQFCHHRRDAGNDPGYPGQTRSVGVVHSENECLVHDNRRDQD